MRASCLMPAFSLLLALQGAARAAAAQQQQQQDEEVVVCEGHVRLSQHADALGPVDLTAASVRLVTDGGTVKDTQFCSPSGYYLLPLDEETPGRPFSLQVVGPPEWLFEEALRVLPEGRCTEDVNFTITGFAVAGEVLSYASGEGVEGIPLLLQPAPAPAAAAAAEAAEAGAAVTGVTRRDGSFALAMPGNGIKILSLGDTKGASWALSPPQQQIKIYGGGKVMPPRVTFKLVAAGLHGKGPSGLGLTAAAVLLLPPECPAVSSPNCGAPPIAAAAAAALLSPDALAAAAPEELHGLLKGGKEGSLCATELDEETGAFAFPLAPLCSSSLLLPPLGLQQQQQQETIALHFSPRVQRVEVTGGRLAVSDIKMLGVGRRGRVVARGKTEVPVAAAKVLLNGADSGVQTAQDGTFLLPYVPLGPFAITAEKEGMILETVQLENVPPFSASLPPIRVLSVSVCGLLLPGVEAQVLGADDPQILKGDSNGKVCFHAAPHSEVSVQLLGGGLSPSVRLLHVGGDTIPNAQLMQLTYKLRGTIICSSSSRSSSSREALKALCAPQHLLLRLKPSGAAGEAQDIPLEIQHQQQQQQQQQVTLAFSVESLAEGTYTLDLTERKKGKEASRICWRRQSLTVSLPPKGGEEGVEDDGDGVVSVSFSSVGFAIAGRSSESMLVAVSPVPQETEEKAASLSYRIPEGPFSLCVPCIGCSYTLNPPTWLRVETRPETFAAAAAGDPVHFTVQSVARRVAAIVSVSLPPQGAPGAPRDPPHDMQLQIEARLLRGDREAPGPFPCTYTRTEKAAAAAGVAVFECELWLAGAAQLAVEAFSPAGLPLLLAQQYVEYPQQQQQQRQQQQDGIVLLLPIQKAETEPQGSSLQLAVEIGCSLEGQIQPPVEGVAVEFYSSKTDAVIASAVSEASGRFASPLLKCLSLPPREELRVKAQKEGFNLKEERTAAAAAPGKGLFLISATKHSSLTVSISEETSGSPLSGVLVSLSEISAGKGTEGHRQRRLTKETGDAFFASLPPGVYSVRAILRGYAFSPLQQIQVKERQQLPIHLTATRVAFNCSGRVRLIGGDGVVTDAKPQETLLTLYAVSPDGSREETPVGPSGDFQLRALRPGLHYEIGVAAPKEMRLEALDPEKRHVVMPSEDVTGLDFLVLLAPPASLLLTVDLSEGLLALEAAGGSLLALLLPVGPERTQPHPDTTQLCAAEAAAAAAAAGDAAAAAGEEPLRLPKGTVAVKLPLTGVALFSGVSTGDYEVAVIHTEATGGSKHLKRGSKLLQAETGPVRVSPESLLRVSLPPLSAAVAADPPSFDPCAPLLPPQAQQEESMGLAGLLVAAILLYFIGGQRVQKVRDWFNASCSLLQR